MILSVLPEDPWGGRVETALQRTWPCSGRLGVVTVAVQGELMGACAHRDSGEGKVQWLRHSTGDWRPWRWTGHRVSRGTCQGRLFPRKISS